MSEPMFLTLNEVVERYRGQISEGTLRNWRSMRVGPSFLKVGKNVLYPLEELERPILHVRIVSGAPFAYKTTNILVRGLFPSNGCLQSVLAANNPNGLVIDLNGAHHGADVGLAAVDIAGFQFFCHQSRKHVDLFCVEEVSLANLRTSSASTHAARTVSRNLPTSSLRRLLSPDND
jgi:hypothetical protein